VTIFRRLFGPSKKEIWNQLATEIEGKFTAGTWGGRTDRVEATHDLWTVTLDTFAVHTGKATIIFTRLRAPFVNPSGFRFKVERRNVFSDVAKWFGAQDVTVGYEPFDHDFVIKGTDERLLRELFADALLRELLEKQPKVRFSVKDDEGWFAKKFPEGVDELCYEAVGIIKDIERLKALYDLFAETLDQLCRIGSASHDGPNLKL